MIRQLLHLQKKSTDDLQKIVRKIYTMYGNVVMGVENYHFEELVNYNLLGVLLNWLEEENWDGLINDFKYC